MRFIKRQDGQGLVEYALLLVLVAVVVIGILMLLGPRVRSTFGKVIGALGGAGDFEYAVSGSPTLSKANQGTRCRLTLSNLTVTVTDLGEPVEDLTVAISISGASLPGTVDLQKKTTQNGVASWSGDSFTVNKKCSDLGGTATIAVAGGVETKPATVTGP